MTTEEVWQAIDAQRQRLVTVMEGFTEDEWRQSSLCEGWTVRDIGAHLSLHASTMASVLVEFVRARGDVDLATLQATRRRARRPIEQIIADLRAMIGSRKHFPGVSDEDMLIDVLVHGLDMTVPLGRELEIPATAAAVAADRIWERGKPFLAQKRLGGFRLVASDANWSAGSGPDVVAPIAAWLLILTGRLVALPQLSGEGAAGLSAKLSPVPA